MNTFEQYPQPFGEIKQEEFDIIRAQTYPTFDANFSTDVFSQQDFKYDMLRSLSAGSYQHTYNEGAPSLLSSNSAPSLPSATSSTVGSPQSGFAQPVSSQFIYPNLFGAQPAIFSEDAYPYGYESAHIDQHMMMSMDNKPTSPFVDPNMISGERNSYFNASFNTYEATRPQYRSSAASPAPSTTSQHSFSAPITVENFDTAHPSMRRRSITSLRSAASPQSPWSNDDEAGKGRCPLPECGKPIKDLKSHMMTHEQVRPEKCPIPSCIYHRKGFARKYDKNRHTLTHYRGTMVCGFCPGSGTAAEKSFNRADVFKRHLTTVHGVEQTAPNGRKRSPQKPAMSLSNYCQDATGKCSTCGAGFENAQDFYEHLDDCVLKVVQQEDPTEAVNARRLEEVANDAEVQAIFERNHIKAEDSPRFIEDDDDDEDDEDEDEDEDELEYNERSGRGVIKTSKVTSNRPVIGGNISKKSTKKGLTWSKGGGSIIGKSRKRRKFYPPSWGMATEKMNMKKRVLCVYDGQRRLLKDDIMMHNEFEVRMPLPINGNHYVTDLDLETMKRADAFHNMDAEDKGPWIPEHDFLQEFLE